MPSRLGDELAENPFLRASDVATLADLRARKDSFRVKLHYSAASPFVRKVMACAITRGIDGQIDLVPANPWASPADLVADNPLSKVPCLVTDDGFALFDSPVICEYLDSVGDVIPLFPAAWRGALAGAQVPGDGGRPAGRRDAAPAGDGCARRKRRATPGSRGRRRRSTRALDAARGGPARQHVDIGTISVACALGYLDFRYADEPWREAHPKLAAWFEEFSRSTRPSRGRCRRTPA